MEDVSLSHAKEHLEELIERARRGEDVRISDAKGGVARLIVDPESKPRGSRIIFGQWKHLSEISQERLLEPLDEESLSWLSGER